ncbi:hypothetical protein AYO45_00805 [Gammaproteobacteria bacterium SCGC AG-212-F23]|nr:hypothetical protein AYO45_00805 [Gammaproteobacteria bacterium SCGC AG-212-F23]
MKQRNIDPEKIDAILPQTQCGLCNYGGCMPYAKAIAEENAAINLCPPGGVTTLVKIAKLVNEDPAPFIPDMQKNSKPLVRAVIREDECIGCTKCIQACPVDAILGTGKLMHTVITDECSGCELCIKPCPVDCIDLVTLEDDTVISTEKSAQYRQRFYAREKRLKKLNTIEIENTSIIEKKNFIQEALLRAKQKKSS